jgi:fructokinase
VKQYYGGIEAGGTKFVCAVGNSPDIIRAKIQFPTTTPSETIARAVDFFRKEAPGEELKAVGIGSFGPLDLDPASSTYGHITATPKPGWADVNIPEMVKEALQVPVVLDTDVNAAALGEVTWGGAQGLDTFVYLTIGTGIGGGAVINGELLHGLVHPEMGHMLLPHDSKSDPFPGICRFHGDCWEGLASGPAILQRWGKPPEDIPLDHAAWDLEARYLALGIMNLVCTLSPERMIIGGGVMQKPGLLNRVQLKVQELLNGYIHSPQITEHIETYLIRPALGNLSGVLGAIALAQASGT